MQNLEKFINMLIGEFDNSDQYEDMKKRGIEFPFAKHINTACDGKIKNKILDSYLKDVFKKI